MNDTTTWAVLAASGLMTLLLRVAFIAGWGRLRLPPALRRALRFVPVAVLVAIIVPDTLMREGQMALSADNDRLLAALAAAAVALLTRNMLLTIAAGFAALALFMNG